MIQEVEFIPDIPAITMELIEHGDLNSFLKQRKEPIGNNIQSIVQFIVHLIVNY